MLRSPKIAAGLVAQLLLTLPGFAQSNKVPSGVRSASNPPLEVSLHQLEIPEKARIACNQGSKRLAANDAAGSIPELDKAIQAFPGFFEAYAKLGAAEFTLQHWGDAAAAFRKSIDLSNGGYAPADFGLGLILATVTKQFADAERVIRAALETAPQDVTGNFELGWVLYSTGRLPEAETYARQAISSQPRFAGARLLLAQIHLEENNPAAVVEDLDDDLALGLNDPASNNDKVRAVRAEAQRELEGPDPTSPAAASR